MKVKYKNSIKYKIEQRINKMRRRIFLREDFADLGCYRQISRIIRRLVEEKKLANIGTGIYAKMRPSVLNDKYVLDGSFQLLAREVLNRLGVKWESEDLEKQYNAGETYQIPVQQGRVKLNSRFNRRIRWGGMELECVS